MNNAETVELIENVVKAHWPDWDINSQQLETWIKSLKPFSFSAVKQAAQDHYASQQGSYKRPKLYVIVEKARVYYRSENPQKKESDPKTNVFIQCIEHKNADRLYDYKPVYIDTVQQDDADFVQRAAEDDCRKAEEFFGGKWIAVLNTTNREMLKQLSEYKGTDGQK